MLKESSKALLAEYGELSITAVVGEYDKGLSIIKKDMPEKKLVLFLGSSIGNFDPIDARKFMQLVRNQLQMQDRFLLGVDMHKDSNVLNAAYNDVRGVTAEFNQNILVRINRELEGNFDVNKFEHKAFYNESGGRVEMHLVSKEMQEVTIAHIGETISFEEGESIHTENSYKFTLKSIEKLVEDTFDIERIWTDKKKWYSVIMLAPK